MGRLARLIVLAAALLPFTFARTAYCATAAASNAVCLACHGNPLLSTKTADGETLSLYVDRDAFAASMHGGKLACTDCHSDISGFPHPAKHFASRRAVTLAYYELCKQCHFAEYSRLLDGVHYVQLTRGNKNAPTCVDCHGSHAIAAPGEPRATVSRTCAKCHQAIAAAYVRSVHGSALLEHGNSDVPVCTTCHRAHDNSNPLTVKWHLQIPQLCARCHTDGALMAKYRISTDVLTTYLEDFHGMTASLQSSEKIDQSKFTATCTDCHGVHDIERVTDPAGAQEIKTHLLTVCRRCHEGAGANFPSAWIGHYEPSPKHAVLVYGVKIFYMIFIPFVIGGLVLQILLDLWRLVVNR